MSIFSFVFIFRYLLASMGQFILSTPETLGFIAGIGLTYIFIWRIFLK